MTDTNVAQRGPMEQYLRENAYVNAKGMLVVNQEGTIDFARQQDDIRAELIAALEPFADLLPMVERLSVQRDSSPIWTLADTTITQGHVRRAADALAKAGA